MELELNTSDQINRIKERCQDIKPLVVIRCITYNHEPYIKDALEGFVMQKTDFPVVAIVHDDASTDNTAAIIREYAEKYPDIIFPIYETENQYSKRDGSLGKIMKAAQDATGAKYVALCEGDDYWTDPLKLQKQVDFLESHPNYTLCFHKVEVKYEKGVRCEVIVPFQHLNDRDYSASEIMEKWTIPTGSTVLIKDAFDNKPSHPNFQYGDNVMWLTCARLGKLRCIGERMGVYRRQSTGFTSDNRLVLSRKQAIHTIGLIDSFTELNSSKVLLKKLHHFFVVWLYLDFKNHLIPLSSLKFATKNRKYIKITFVLNECRLILLRKLLKW